MRHACHGWCWHVSRHDAVQVEVVGGGRRLAGRLASPLSRPTMMCTGAAAVRGGYPIQQLRLHVHAQAGDHVWQQWDGRYACVWHAAQEMLRGG